MTIDTNASETAAAYIPSAEEWGRMHSDWFSKLVDLLKWYHCKHDREDAVQEAFLRLMPGRKDGIKAIPRTSNEWFFKILGEARGILSHENRRMKRFVYASQNADEDGTGVNPIERIPDERSQAAFDAMDTDILVMAARDTFNEICSKAGVSDTNKEAYWRRYLDGEGTQSVTRDLGIKSNNLYQIGNRIGRLISSSSAKDIFEKRLADLASQGLAA